MPEITTDPTQQLGKFVVITGSPPSLPGCCFLCSTTKQDIRYIDPRRDLEWHGTIYICEDCVIEMAHNLGMTTKGESEDLADDNRILTERLAVAYKKLEDLEQTVDLLSQRRLSDRVIESSNNVGTGQDPLPSDVKDAELDDNGTKESESGITESVDEQGPDDVSVTTSNDATAGVFSI